MMVANEFSEEYIYAEISFFWCCHLSICTKWISVFRRDTHHSLHGNWEALLLVVFTNVSKQKSCSDHGALFYHLCRGQIRLVRKSCLEMWLIEVYLSILAVSCW